MSILDDDSVLFVQQVIANPPTTMEQLNMALALHVRVSIEFKMKSVLLGLDIEELDEERELMNKFWGVLAEAMETDLPMTDADEEDESSDFTLMNNAGNAGVHCRVVRDHSAPYYGNNPFQQQRSRTFHVRGNNTRH